MRKTISSAKSLTAVFRPCASRKRKALKSSPARRACRSRIGTPYRSRYDRMEPPSVCKRAPPGDRKSTRLNSSHANISYAVFCLKKKKTKFNKKILQHQQRTGEIEESATL